MNTEINLAEILRHDDNFQSIMQNMLQTAFEVSFDGVMITEAGPDYPIIYVNPAFCALSGYGFSELLGKSPALLHGEGTDREVLAELKERITAGKNFHGMTYNYKKDGTKFLMEWKIVPIKNETGKISHYFAIQREISKNSKMFMKPYPLLSKKE